MRWGKPDPPSHLSVCVPRMTPRATAKTSTREDLARQSEAALDITGSDRDHPSGQYRIREYRNLCSRWRRNGASGLPAASVGDRKLSSYIPYLAGPIRSSLFY